MFMHQIFAFLPRSFRDLKIPKQTSPKAYPEHSWAYWLLADPCAAMSSGALQTRTHFLRNWYQPKSWEENMAPPLSGEWEKWSRKNSQGGGSGRAWALKQPWEQRCVFPEGCSSGNKLLKDFSKYKKDKVTVTNYSLVKEFGTGNLQEPLPPKELWDDCEMCMRCGKLGNDRVLYSQDKI